MKVSHTGKYAKVITLAEKHGARDVSFQHHTFVSFKDGIAAIAFGHDVIREGFNLFWDVDKPNTNRPGTPFEVIVERWQ